VEPVPQEEDGEGDEEDIGDRGGFPEDPFLYRFDRCAGNRSQIPHP
jgi:hypothetical protein